MLGEIARTSPADGAGPAEKDGLCLSLHVEELALARGCAAGNERAWEDFLSRYRERLHRAARGIAGSDSKGKELADSLYAELFGTRLRQGQRASKLLQYSGRGSLEGWLRIVLAQEFINGYPRTCRDGLCRLKAHSRNRWIQDTPGCHSKWATGQNSTRFRSRDPRFGRGVTTAPCSIRRTVARIGRECGRRPMARCSSTGLCASDSSMPSTAS